MRIRLLTLLFLMLTAVPVLAMETVAMETSHGTIVMELNAKQAPESVANFLAYMDAGFYDGTIFHRVIDDFMIQGGGFDTNLQRKTTRPPIANEAGNGLRNRRGTLAMARTQVVDSATSQFFINLKDNAFLDHRSKTRQGYGYAVFGRVVEGMEVVDRIGSSPTRRKSAMFADLPVEPVVIRSIRRAAE